MENTQQKDTREGLVVDVTKLVSAPRGIKNRLNVDEDAWAVVAPPKHDIYCLKPQLGKNGIRFYDKGMKDSYGRTIDIPYYSVNIEHRIVAETDPDAHMFPVFQPLTTRIGRGKQISTAAGFIVKLVGKKNVPEEADDLQIVQILVEALRLEKVFFAEVDWRASYKEDDGSYQNVCNTMTDFPRDSESGEYLHRMKISNRKGRPVEVQAQLQVVHLISRKEYKEMSESGEIEKFKASQPQINKAQLAAEEEEDEAPAPPKVVTVPKVNGTPQAPQVVKKPKKSETVPIVEEEVVVSAEKVQMALVEDED